MSLDRRAVLGAAAAGALAYPAQAWAAPGGRRVINAMMTAEPAHLNLPLFNTRIMQEICGNINEPLLRFDWKFNPHPHLASDFNMAPDGMTYTFHLRKDVVWHDGVKFTARDVVFSCGTLLPQLNPRSRNAFSHIDRIEAPDAYTVKFHMKEPFNAFLLSLMASSAPMMPAHIYEGTDFRTNPFNSKPIGTGPFRFQEWARGRYIHLTRNPHYWRPGKPQLDDIFFRLVGAAEQRMVALETGAVDIAFSDGLDPVIMSRLRADPNLVCVTNAYDGDGEIGVVEVNQRRAPFNDRRFRAAFLHAHDRDFMVRGLNFGMGKVATGPIPSNQPYYDPKAVTPYPFDPARARSLLDEMGLKPKAGGVRVKVGMIMLPDGGGAWTRFAQYSKQALGDVGIDVELQSVDWATYMRRNGEWDYDLCWNSYGMYGDPAIGMSRLFVSTNIRKGVPATNVQGYVNPEVDRLFAAAAIATDRARAQAHYSRLQQILTRDAAMLWILETRPPIFYNRRLSNMIIGPNGPTDGFGEAVPA